MLPLIALFLFVFEFGGVTQLGVTGGVRPGSGPLGAWFFYSGIAMIFIWAWRDQPGRCRVCLRHMRQPCASACRDRSCLRRPDRK